RGFQFLVDQAARCVAGHELFAGLGPMRRIVTTGPGAESIAELITQPIELAERGLFSLLVKLEVVTFPSLGQPLVTLEVSKRCGLCGFQIARPIATTFEGACFHCVGPSGPSPSGSAGNAARMESIAGCPTTPTRV